METIKVGVYICHCGVNIKATVDVDKLTQFSSDLPPVSVAKSYIYLCSDPGQELIKKDIEEFGLNRIVVASCSPRMHEPTFRKVLRSAGINPYCLEMANIREHCSWVHDDPVMATQKAEALVSAAVAKTRLLEPLEEKEIDVIPAALVIGGGIAGIQTSLDIADTGFKVYLVEKQPSIGGHMMQLDKTFPTLDCSACILTPKMSDVGNHPNIELHTYSEVVDVKGYVGNFQVTIKKKPRYIIEEKCNACGLCVPYCPVEMPDPFNMNFSKIKCLYIPFPQAVPSKYVIDPTHCRYTLKRECKQCELVCKDLKAINLKQKEQLIQVEVGTIIVATGFDIFDPILKPELGYGLYPNVITGLEFERLSSASGPNLGDLLIHGKKPKEVVFIQCVGSRDKSLGNEYCSRVCCMYTAKQAHLVREKIPDATITIFYMDVRAFGKGFEEFYDRVKQEGVIYRRGNVAEVFKRKNRLIVRAEDTLLGQPIELEADLVVLAVGMVPSKDSPGVAQLLKLSQSADKFFLEAHPKLRPVDTASDGIFLAGCCQGPKDIPDTVAQASAAAARALTLIAKGKVAIEAAISVIDEEFCSGCKTCISLCPYDAISFNAEKGISFINEALCKGCGTCAASCPSSVIVARHFTTEEIMAQIEGVVL